MTSSRLALRKMEASEFRFLEPRLNWVVIRNLAQLHLGWGKDRSPRNLQSLRWEETILLGSEKGQSVFSHKGGKWLSGMKPSCQQRLEAGPKGLGLARPQMRYCSRSSQGFEDNADLSWSKGLSLALHSPPLQRIQGRENHMCTDSGSLGGEGA